MEPVHGLIGILNSLALLLIGFSLFSSALLALTHFRREHYQGQLASRNLGLILLLALSGLQLAHFFWLEMDLPYVQSWAYRVLLFAVAPVFFLFSQPLLNPGQPPSLQTRSLLHSLPIIAATWIPENFALPMAFVIGALYLLWLARSLYGLRQERSSFRREILLLGGIFGIAISVSLLGLFEAALPHKLFFSLYACAIGMAFFLVQVALGNRPQLSTEVSETARASYANTTLANVDCEAVLVKMDALMATEKRYVDPDLSLPKLAGWLDLNQHQLSELLNAKLGKGFSRYLRELRIDAAKQMLLDEPSASVLSIGLSVGFTSQSNFYEAFREIQGMTPGQYRKLNASGSPSR